MKRDRSMTAMTALPVGALEPHLGEQPDQPSLLSYDPAEHVAVALTHLGLSDLGALEWPLRRLLAGVGDPRVLLLVGAITDAVAAERDRRERKPMDPPGPRGIFGTP